MRSRYWMCLLMVLVTAMLLTGCWDSEDIEKQNNVSLVIVDFGEDQYRLFIEIANVFGLNPQNAKGMVDYSVLTASGDSLIAVRDEINRRCDFPLFLGATRAVVFTQEMAEKGIEEYINRLRAELDYRKSVLIFTSSTDPLTMINDQPENNHSVGDALQDTLENQKRVGQTFVVNVGDVLQILALQNVGFLIPQMSMEEAENTLTGYSVFKEAKCIGTIPAEERKGIVYLLGSDPEFYYEIYDENNHFIFNVVLNKKRIKAQYAKEQVTFEIDMSFEYELKYMNETMKITKEQQEKLTQKLTELVEKDITKAIKDSQRTYGSDYLEFYKYFRARYLSAFKEMNWDEIYNQSDMNVSVNGKIIGAQ